MDQPTMQQEVAGLDRVLTRLAMTDDEKLEGVLHKLIPAVLGTLKSPHDATRKKVMEIMAHVNKRVKGHTSLKLPLSDLAHLTHDANPMVRSFALVYCETAMERASKAERLAAVGPLLLGVGGRAGQQKAMCLRLAVAGLEGLESSTLPATPASTTLPQDEKPPTSTPGGTGSSSNKGVPSPSSTPAPAAAAISLPGSSDARGAAWAAAVQRYPFLGRDEDRAAFLSFAMKLMLLVPRTVSPAQLQAQQQQQQQQLPGSLRILGFHPPPPPTPAAPPPPPPGLSDADLTSLMDKVPPARQQSTTQAPNQAAGGAAGMELPSGEPLVKRKLGILNFLEGARLPPREILLLLVVAACDPYDAVSKRGEELQKKLCSTDGTRPAVNLEQEEGVLKDAFTLFHGNASGVTLNTAVPEGQRVQPASPAVRSRLLSLFCKSVAAANIFPQTITTIQEAVFGSGSSVRLKQQGMEFSVWVCKHAAHSQLKAMAPAVLQGLLGTLERGGDLAASPEMASSGAPLPTDHTSVTLRGFAYQATGALVQRVPESLAGRIDVAHRFFAALSAEPPGLRATVAEAASCLSAAFQADTLSPQQASELNDLLLASIGAHQDALRLCAVQWANRLFPLDHVQARWICVLAASDPKLEVRDEGARGLRLSPINLTPLEPSPLLPIPPPASPLSHDQVAGTAAASGSAPASAANGEGQEAMAVDGGAPAADKASIVLAPPPERRPDLVAMLRYAASRVPALLPPRAFGGPSVPPAGAAAAAAATQRAQGGDALQGIMAGQAEEGGGRAMASTEGAPAVDPAPMPDPARVLPVNPRSYLALMRFAHQCLASQLQQQQQQQQAASHPAPAATAAAVTAGGSGPQARPYVPGVYLTLLEGALTRDATSELVAAALQELLDVVMVVPEDCEARFSTRVSWLCGFLAHVDPSARAAAAKLVGVASAALEPQAAQQLLTTLTSSFGTTPTTTTGAASSVPAAAPGAVAAATASSRTPAAPPKFEAQEGSILAAGCVLFHCLRGRPPLPPPHPQPPTSALLTAALSHPTPLMASTAALSIALCSLSNTPLQALLQLQSQAEEGAGTAAPSAAGTQGAVPPGGDAAPAVATTATAGGTPAPAAAAAPTPPAPAEAATGAEAAANAMRSRVAKEAEMEAAEEADRARLGTVVGEGLAALVRRILTLMGDRDVKVAVRAIHAAGYLAWGFSDTEAANSGSGGCSADPLLLRVLLRGLLKLSTQKNEEIVFAAGEALAYVVGSVPVSRDQVLRSNFTSLADEFALLTSTGTPTAPPAPPAAAIGMEVDGASTQEGSPTHAAACLASRAAVQEELLQRLMDDMVVHSRAEVRCAAAVWLVSLLTYCGRHPALLPRLSEIQEALGGLLGDANELTQEMASRGVSMVYALGDASARSKLVESLVGVLQGTNSRAAKVKLQGDTRVFEEGAIGNAPGGGSLSTYQELCSMATEVGQPDLVYKFMDLAHHQQALNTKRGAAFGFAGIARLVAGEALKPHVQRLLPRLYRYQYDPNPRVQEAMSGIWKALVDDPKAALDAALPTLMQDLTQELGGRLWRNRQAAAAALADLLQGRRWPELAPHFTTLWMMTFRAMDDIKESVRHSASILARSLRGVTLRLVDASLSPPADAAAAVAVVLPLMIEHGLSSTVTEVRMLALDIISQTARSASPASLKPLLPALVQAMLEGLSSLEDSRLNYIEQHAERLGMDADRLDSARTSAARASPLGETLELCARVAGSDPSEGGALETVLPTVANIIRHGVGLNTKVGAARFARSLTSRAGSAMRTHAPPLLKALTSATRAERSNTVRKAYAGAAALICRYAAPKRVEWFVNTAVEMHKGGSGSSEGGGGDKDARYAAGLLLRELLRSAPEAFAAQAASEALPVAFGAKMDEDTDVAAVWKEVWEEGSSSEAGAVRLYAPEIVTLLVEGLGSQQWGRKQASAQAVVRLTELGHDLLNGSTSATGTAEGADAGGASSSSPACVLAEALLAEAGGRLWDGKESVLQALAALAKSAPAALSSLPKGGHARVVEAALAGTQRRKASFRVSSAKLLQACLASFEGDYYDLVAPTLLQAVHTHATPSTAAPPTASASGAPAPRADEQPAADDEDAPLPPLPLVEALGCLDAAFVHCKQPLAPRQEPPLRWQGEKSGEAAAGASEPGPGTAGVVVGPASRGDELVACAAKVLSMPLPWQQRLASLNLASTIAARGQALQQGHNMGPAAMEVDGAEGHAGTHADAPARWAGELVQAVAVCTADVAVQQSVADGWDWSPIDALVDDSIWVAAVKTSTFVRRAQKCEPCVNLSYRPSCLSQVLEKQLIEAFVLAKQRDSSYVAQGDVNIFNHLLLQFPAMRPGFLRVQELFALLAPEHQLHLPLRTLKEHAKTIGLDVEQEHLKPIFVFDDDYLLPQELIMVFTVAYIAAGKESPSTQDINPDIKACLDIVEKAFLSFDSSSRGFLPAAELRAVIKNNLKVVGSTHHHKNHPGMGKMLYQDLPCDESGNVTFKEFLLRIQTLVMSEIVDMDEMQELEEFAFTSKAASLGGDRLSLPSRHSSVTEATREALVIVNKRRSFSTPEPQEVQDFRVHNGHVNPFCQAKEQGPPRATKEQLQPYQLRERWSSGLENQQEAGDKPAKLESQLQDGQLEQQEGSKGMPAEQQQEQQQPL